jgi:predicted MPP superfamily phosphohydrolase
MLLVGDIHINAKYKDLILSELKDKILSTKEKYIIFLGDYVYHFVYDKKSLSELFKFFLKLFSKGRKVIVLAGNHDWINQTFVFEEVADLVKILSFDGFDIIVKPQILEVDGKQCLFLPYNIYLDWNQVFEEFGLDISKKSIYDTLINSSHKGERYSGYLNKFVEQFIEKYSDIYIFHHFYFSDIDFVGQKGKFTFKDVSLDGKKFLRQGDSVKFISGHLHQPFAWRNYFCTGSVWATTPLEYNQYKFLFKFDWEKFEPIPLNTNYYLRLEYKN